MFAYFFQEDFSFERSITYTLFGPLSSALFFRPRRKKSRVCVQEVDVGCEGDKRMRGRIHETALSFPPSLPP